MPATDFLPRRLYDSFTRSARFSDSLKSLIALQANPEFSALWDDFTGTRTGTWPAGTPYSATVGTGTEVIGITQAVGGTLTLTTGGTSGNSAGQGFGLNWSGDRGFYFISRCKLSRTTNVKFEIGMTDAVDDDGAVDVKATPTFTAADCAVAVYDTSDDTKVTFVFTILVVHQDHHSTLANGFNRLPHAFHRRA